MFQWFKNLFVTYQKPLNSGVVDAPLRSTDYIAGANSPVIYKERLSDGNWFAYVWSQVKQWSIKNGVGSDNFGCTGNSLATLIETTWFFLTGQKRQVSRRWINKMSGCNQGELKGIGNYIIAPVDWVRKNGFVWEEDYPTPDYWTADEYYAPIPEPLNSQLLKKALDNKSLFKGKGVNGTDCLEYEYLSINDPNIDKHLKQAPLGCTIPGHQVMGFYSPDIYTKYRDSYEPWDKQYASSQFKNVLKIIMELNKIEARTFKFQDSPELWVGYPIDSLQTLEKVKKKDLSWLDNYIYPDNEILVLPTKKPL